MHFRSSVYNADGELISASFPKFFNWGEHPELTPLPKSLDGATLMEKLDGSTLIVSKYKGNFMIRTRGTIDASKMEKNGWEVEFLMEKYPEIKNKAKSQDTWNYSLIFEWISPNNQIVINYTEPDIRLIGCICHDDYRLVTQSSLETLAKDLGIGRPQSFKFDTIEEMTTAIEGLKGQEGIVVYFNNDQSLLKVKGAWYLALHRMKSELSSIDGIADLYFSLGGNLSYDEFMKHITDVFDYELAKMIMGSVSKIVDSKKEVVELG
jgi:T4 RnlA family RNA ligase